MSTTEKLLPIGGWFSEKLKLFINGRRDVFSHLKSTIAPGDQTIWFHAASLGEYEQAVPVIEVVKKHFGGNKIVVSFFSPSGYEVKKNRSIADVTVYLPLDTKSNVRMFLDLVHPTWALFIKYEFWPNYLKELKNRKIRTLLISGSFREDQFFFKPYGSWMRSYLKAFEHFFVQNARSEELLDSIGFENVTISGDTRFDRVSRQIEQDNQLEFIESFCGSRLCVVAGSTWPEDEELLIPYINRSSEEVKFIIAPHTMKPARFQQLQKSLAKRTVLYSGKEGKDLFSYQVFIIDIIGLLTKIYNYAHIAYVGGAAGTTGLHNILEPATFGIPIIIGKNFSKFPEAKELQRLAGLFAAEDGEELADLMEKLVRDEEFRKATGMIAGHFINSNTGATETITQYLLKG